MFSIQYKIKWNMYLNLRVYRHVMRPHSSEQLHFTEPQVHTLLLSSFVSLFYCSRDTILIWYSAHSPRITIPVTEKNYYRNIHVAKKTRVCRHPEECNGCVGRLFSAMDKTSTCGWAEWRAPFTRRAVSMLVSLSRLGRIDYSPG